MPKKCEKRQKKIKKCQKMSKNAGQWQQRGQQRIEKFEKSYAMHLGAVPDEKWFKKPNNLEKTFGKKMRI